MADNNQKSQNNQKGGEEKKPAGKDQEIRERENRTMIEGIAIFVIILLAGQLLSSFVGNIRNTTGFDPGRPSTLWRSRELRLDAPLGMRVALIRSATVLSRPSGGEVFGSQMRGISGVLQNGPAQTGDDFWWQVDFDTGADGWVEQDALRTDPPLPWLARYINTYLAVALILSVLLIAGITYCWNRINEIRKEDRKRLNDLFREHVTTRGQYVNDRWQQVLTHLESVHESDWKLAILEADIMLSEMMDRMGYTQETLSEKLKNVERSDFKTIDKAWEAHKVRNEIAHQGSSYTLSHETARRVVNLYRDVFQEFEYI